jgi:AP-1 complex subunit mu
MVASAVFILDLKGKVLIARNYRGDVNMGCVEKFLPLMLDEEESAGGSGYATPVLTEDGISYLYVKHNNLYRKWNDKDKSPSGPYETHVRRTVLAVTRKNSNATTILLFLHKLVEVCLWVGRVCVGFRLTRSAL